MTWERGSSNSIKHSVFSGKIELVKTHQIVLSERRWLMACHRDRCVAHLCSPIGMASHHKGQMCKSQKIGKNSQLPRGSIEKQVPFKWRCIAILWDFQFIAKTLLKKNEVWYPVCINDCITVLQDENWLYIKPVLCIQLLKLMQFAHGNTRY